MLTIMSASAAPYVNGRTMGARVQRGCEPGQVCGAKLASLLQENGFEPLVQLRSQMRVAHQETRAGIPAQDGIVVPSGTGGFGPLVAVHGVAKPFVGHGPGSRPALVDEGARPALGNDPGVVALVGLVAQTGQAAQR